jgi:hypothetical protein
MSEIDDLQAEVARLRVACTEFEDAYVGEHEDRVAAEAEVERLRALLATPGIEDLQNAATERKARLAAEAKVRAVEALANEWWNEAEHGEDERYGRIVGRTLRGCADSLHEVLGGCCTACKGEGYGYGGEPCWDCRGTGHPHPRSDENTEERENGPAEVTPPAEPTVEDYVRATAQTLGGDPDEVVADWQARLAAIRDRATPPPEPCPYETRYALHSNGMKCCDEDGA